MYITYNANYAAAPHGLQNRGATCWLNSIIQLFFSLPSLRQLAHEIEHSGARNKFLKLFNALYNDPSNDANITNLHKYLIKSHGQSTPTHLIAQECAVEGFDMILASFKSAPILKLFTTVYKMSFDCPSCHTTISQTRDMTYRIDLFTQSDLLSRPDSPGITTREQFQQYVLSHISQLDEYRCDRCHAHIRNLRRLERLCQVHEILIFTLNKFYDKTKIWFPEHFDLPFSQDGKIGRAHYRLVCHVMHSGTLSGGHYWAHGLRRHDTIPQWFALNDNSVASGAADPTAESFILAYHMSHITF